MNDAQLVLRNGSRSFFVASQLLPREKRDDAAHVYAFCRMVDDLADDAVDRTQARRALDRVLAGLAGRTVEDPTVAAFLDAAARSGIELEHARLLIEGVASDLDLSVVEDDRQLIRYCYQVAGTVGLMMCPLLGVTRAEARPFAIDLGIAMQLTNVCRDVAEDAQRGRVYLPRSRLEGAGIDASALAAGRPIDRSFIAPVISDLIQLADRYYESGCDGLRFIPFRARAAIRVAAHVYREIGRTLVRRGADPFGGRTIMSGARRMWIAAAALASLLGRPQRSHDHRLHSHLGGLPGAR